MKIRSFLFLIVILSFSLLSNAQTIDRILAVVGENVILFSDVEGQVAYLKANGRTDDGTLRCQIMEKLIVDKLLLNKAKQDSVEVTEDQVESELERKLNYFISGYGGVDKLEEVYGKPLIEIRADLRPDIKDQLLIDRMQGVIISKVAVTPREVKRFYGEIPVDSLPYLPAEVEVFHLVKRPKPTATAIRESKKFLESLRKQIVSGEKDFAEVAKRHSQDFGSARTGGLLPEFSRGRMVPEFEEVAYQMKVGEVSPVFKSEYGHHILKVEKKVGEIITARHVLISARVGIDDDSIAVRKLREIHEMITGSDTLSFEKAARKYSDDEPTKSCGGCIKNPQTGEQRIPLDLLDGDFYLTVDGMKVGEVTEPIEWIQPDNKKSFHILYLKLRVPPHVANLKQDYRNIHEAALQAKQSEALEKWFVKARKNVFIEIKDPACREVLINWIQ